MSCISATLTRIQARLSASLQRSASMSVAAVRVGGIEAAVDRLGGRLSAHVNRVVSISGDIARIGGSLNVRLTQVCTPNLEPPYLEIEPQVVWVYAGLEATNDVFSNTNRNIN